MIGRPPLHNQTAGYKPTPEYYAWTGMIQRCHNPKAGSYPNYGGRGISVCAEWLADFRPFLAHVGRRPSPKHSIDRIDCDGNYEPGNVRWATQSLQGLNRRESARLFDLDDNPISAKEVAHHLAMPRSSFLLILRRSMRGRFVPKLVGEKHPLHKLTAQQVLLIVQRVRAGETPAALAHEHNVSNESVYSIMCGKSWRQVTRIERIVQPAGPSCP